MTINSHSPKTPNFWDARYQTDEYIFGFTPNDFLQQSVQYLPKDSAILCIGEGEGRNAVFLAKQEMRVTALDMSMVGLAKAAELAKQNRVTIDTVVADLTNYEFHDAAWDGVVSIFCHLPSILRTSVHQRIVKALRPGGVYLLEAYTPAQLEYQTGGPKDPDMLYTLNALRQELSGLEFLHGAESIREVKEGIAHQGLAAVVQVVARKPTR